MITVSVQLVISVGICFGAVFTALGIFLERLKVRQEQRQQLIRRFEARRTQPTRICGAWVWYDGKKKRHHHCVLHEDHAADHHRSATGVGRRVEDGLTTGII